jgi:hypothetical protein
MCVLCVGGPQGTPVNDTNFSLIADFVESRRRAKQAVTLIGLAGSQLSRGCGQLLLELLDVLAKIDAVGDDPLTLELSKVLHCPHILRVTFPLVC